jgi:hypothetical protein
MNFVIHRLTLAGRASQVHLWISGKYQLNIKTIWGINAIVQKNKQQIPRMTFKQQQSYFM